MRPVLTLTGLMLGVGGLAAVHLAPALAAESSAGLSALNAEVQILKADQKAMQADLEVIKDLLIGRRQALAPETEITTPQTSSAAVPIVNTVTDVGGDGADGSAAAAPADDAEIAALKKELEAMKKIVARYRERDELALLARAPVRDFDFTIDVGDDPFKGSADARVTLIEFTDYQCPFCRRHNRIVMPELLKNYVETGKVRYVVRDYPLMSIHKYAAKAHEAAHCAGDQGKYWEMHDQLFDNQRALMARNLPGYAEAAGVADMATFQSCLESGLYAERSKRSLAEGAKAGISGTPSFLLGMIQPDGTVKVSKFIRGAQSYQVFEDAIKEVLSSNED